MNDDSGSLLEGLFHAARKLKGDARDRFLDQACANDSRAKKQIEIMLYWDAAPDTFLDDPIKPPFLLPDTLIDRYRIIEVAGIGGMGEVYRAWDPRIQRDVAIKSLPAEFATSTDRAARLLREAKVLGGLNHPNIAAIYDLVESQGRPFLVLEFIEGPTLSETLKQGPLPLPEVLAIASQVVLALEAAHQAGTIHRDLKPGNIKVAPKGPVKVLDFGLAAAVAGNSEQGMEPSLATQRAFLSGTPAYMSPAQACAEPPDTRDDIWAFGCLLFEMLTGQRAFPGATVSATLDVVRAARLDWSILPGDTLPDVERLLRRCLEKDAARRIQDSGELRRETQAIVKSLEDSRKKPIRWPPFPLPLDYAQTRKLFILTQIPYVAGYLIVFYHWNHVDLERALARTFSVPVDVSLPILLMMSLLGLAVRVYFLSLVGWKHQLAAHRFKQVFPALIVLDGLWAATPLLIFHSVHPVVSLPGMVLMVWLLFGQRTVMLSIDRDQSVAPSPESLKRAIAPPGGPTT